jgi:hypothetical protein
MTAAPIKMTKRHLGGNQMNPRDKTSEHPPFELMRAREETAKRLREAEAAAKEVAELCKRAMKAARRHKAPNPHLDDNDSQQT